MAHPPRWLVTLLGLALTGCQGGSPGMPDATDPPPADAGLLVQLDSGDGTRCDEVVRLAPPEALAATPREDDELEQLALAVGGTFTADATVYERLVAEVSLIRSLAPAIADLSFSPRVERALSIWADDDVVFAMEHGRYAEWNCLNAYYGATYLEFGAEHHTHRSQAILHFPGVYDYRALAALYQALPHLRHVYPITAVWDESTICVSVDGGMYHYVFDRALGCWGDGCTSHQYTYFSTGSADDLPVPGGQWADDSGEPPPPWAVLFTPCR